MSAATEEFSAVEDSLPKPTRPRRFLRGLSGGRVDASRTDGEPAGSREAPKEDGVVTVGEDRDLVTACFRLPPEQLDALHDLVAIFEATPTTLGTMSTQPHAPSTASDIARVVRVSLPCDDFSTLRELATRRSTSPTQIVIQALRTEMFLQRLVDRGASILASFGGRGREILFDHMRVI